VDFRHLLPGSRITHRANAVTGEMIPVEPWVTHIHPDAWEWFERHWAAEDEFDFKLQVAGIL
jgi:hypothetical protein